MKISILLLSVIFNNLHLLQSNRINHLLEDDTKVNSNLIICHHSGQYRTYDGIIKDRKNLQYQNLNANKGSFNIAKKSQYKCGFNIRKMTHPVKFDSIPYDYYVYQGAISNDTCDNNNIICLNSVCNYDETNTAICCNYNFCNENHNINLIKATLYPKRSMSNDSYDQSAYDKCYSPRIEREQKCLVISYKNSIDPNKATSTDNISNMPYTTATTSNNNNNKDKHSNKTTSTDNISNMPYTTATTSNNNNNKDKHSNKTTSTDNISNMPCTTATTSNNNNNKEEHSNKAPSINISKIWVLTLIMSIYYDTL